MPSKNKLVVFVMGITCSGKTSLMDAAGEFDYHDETFFFGQIRIGEELRKRYPSAHFAGQGAPEHTEKEALTIYRDGLERSQLAPITLVDGQPRKVSHVVLVVGHALKLGYACHALVLHASEKEIRRRAAAREGNDPAGLKLALDRIEHDSYMLYQVLNYLHVHSQVPVSFVDAEDRSIFPHTLRALLTLHEGINSND